MTLIEIGTAYAGKEFKGEVKPGECVRVMTGAVMPANTDTVVIQEAVTSEGRRVTVPPWRPTSCRRVLRRVRVGGWLAAPSRCGGQPPPGALRAPLKM